MSGISKHTSRIAKRNEKLRERYTYYTEKKHFNTEYTLSLLADEFITLEPQTIWLIISKTGYYKNS